MPTKEVRDAIHGLIDLRVEEWRVIATRPFQRLRGVQQLAFTHLVYPSARHSRFEHSIGCCHIAGRIADKLGLDKKRTRRVRLAALVHDIGHGPFSHVSEEVMKEHEAISAALLVHHPGIKDALPETDREYIAQLLTESGSGKKRSVERDMIAGPADVDKFDYLLRDSYFCGVEYGRYDLHKILESARSVPEYGGKTALGFHEDAIYALEEMVLGRHHMHRQVYAHKTRLATDRMIVRAIRFGIQEGTLPTSVFSPSELDEAFVNEFVEWDDARVVRTLCSETKKIGGQLMRSLLDRHLYKRLFRYGLDELRKHLGIEYAGYAASPDKEVLKEKITNVEAAIAESAEVEAHWVCLYWENLKNPLSGVPSLTIDDKEIVLLTDDDEPRKFIEASDIFQNAELPTQPFVSLFVRPSEGKTFSKAQKKRIEAALIQGLKDIASAQAVV